MAKKALKESHKANPRIRRGDTVKIRKGKDVGKQGEVIRVLRDKDAVLVQGLNYVKRHTRPNPQVGRQGGVMEKEAPIRLSNVMAVCPECEKPTRIAREQIDDGRWVRKCKKCGNNF